MWIHRLPVAVLLIAAATTVQPSETQPQSTPHPAPIRYVDRAPQAGTPQAAMLNLVLFREERRLDEAALLISKQCPGWLREGMLTTDGSMKRDTLTYQLREFTAEKALVSVDYNLTDGTFKGWTRTVILEDGKWVVR